nr:hypothetical protein [uncultured Schaedlerella sp.]
MNKEKKVGFIFSIIMIVLTCIIYKIRLEETYSISMLINKLSYSMQIRQIAASYYLFILGYWLMPYVEPQWGMYRRIVFSYIVGTAIWGALSILYLCVGIKYNLVNMTIGCIIVGGINHLLLKKNMIRKDLKSFLSDSFIFIGIASIASTGLMYTFGSCDSQYLIQQWGKDLAIMGVINERQHGLLTSTGILPATFSSLSYFWGADNMYTIHHVLELCFWIFFGSAVGETIFFTDNISLKKRYLVSIFLTIFVYRLPPIQLLSGWIMSNMYMMVYSFVLCYFLYMDLEQKLMFCNKLYLYIIVGAITLLRTDSSITMCIILGCFAICYSDQVKKLFPFLVIAFFAFLSFYFKIYLVLKGDVDGMLINLRILLLMGMCFWLIGCYMVVAKYIMKILKKTNIISILYCSLLILNIGLFVVFKDTYVNNFIIIVKNMIDLSIIGGHWGSSLGITVLCIFYIMSKREKQDVFFLLGVCSIVIYMDFGVIRTINDTVTAARFGFGDSMNRAIISTLPIIFFDFYRKLFSERFILKVSLGCKEY